MPRKELPEQLAFYHIDRARLPAKPERQSTGVWRAFELLVERTGRQRNHLLAEALGMLLARYRADEQQTDEHR